MSSEKLSSAEKRDLIIQSGIEAIPYVGGPLSTLLFRDYPRGTRRIITIQKVH